MKRNAHASTLEIDIHNDSDGMKNRIDELKMHMKAWDELQLTYGDVLKSKKTLQQALIDLAATFTE